jgi:hypothetical protein
MKLAGGLDIDADRLREEVARARNAPRRQAGGRPATRAATGAPESTRMRATTPRVDRRELDLLLYAVHDGAQVDGWIDAQLFHDAVARAAFEAILDSPDVHDAIEATDGPVRALLERVAVEEPSEDGEPQTLRARLMANAIGPAAERVLAGMVRAGDGRASSVKVLLDSLTYARDTGDWDAAQRDADQLLGWIEEGTRGVGAT